MSKWHTLDTEGNLMAACTSSEDEEVLDVLSDVRDLLGEILPILKDVGFLVEGLSRRKDIPRRKNTTLVMSDSLGAMTTTSESTQGISQIQQPIQTQRQPVSPMSKESL